MANQVKFDYTNAKATLNDAEIKMMSKIVNDAKEQLVSKTGAGNDFLGWIDLPVNYDKEEFAREIAALPKICPHFHLSMQSGCNETLRRMNRHYTSEEYYEKCEILRKHYEKPAITTDVIVGFPQESVEEFETTEKFVEKVNFFETHIFKYSKRQGTNAAKMEGKIPEEEKTRRSSILLDMNKRHRQAYLESFLGKTIEILVEEDMKADGQEYQTGHTKEYMRAIVKSDKSLENQIVKAVVKEVHQGEMLKCEIID